MVPIYIYVAVAIIAILVLSLCVGAVLQMRRSRQVKKPDSATCLPKIQLVRGSMPEKTCTTVALKSTSD